MEENIYIENQKELFQKKYDKWRNVNSKDKVERQKILLELDELAEIINKIDVVFTSAIFVRLAVLSLIAKNFKIAKKYFLKVIAKADYLKKDIDVLEYAYRGLGDLYFEKKKYKKASEQYFLLQKIQDIEELLEEDILQMTTAMLNTNNQKYLKAAEQLLQYLFVEGLCDDKMDHLFSTQANNNMGIIKYKQGKYNEAKPYLEKALTLYKQRKWDCKNISRLLNNIADTDENKPLSSPNK